MYRFINAEKANHSIRILCRVLRVSRAAYYAWRAVPQRRRQAEAGLRARIRSIHKASGGTYGSPRVTAALAKDGPVVNRKKVTRLMKAEGLRGVPRRRFRGTTTDSNHDCRIAPNLLKRDFHATRPNQVWVADITYLRVGSSWAYLAVIIDLYSRKVVGWSLDDHMRTELVAEAFKRACAVRAPAPGLLHHSDRGVQYASAAYTDLLEQAGAIQSMSRKGNCWDNAVAESFFGTLKQELVAGRTFTSVREARAEVGTYLHHFYNATRLHSTLGFHSPVELENQLLASMSEAA